VSQLGPAELRARKRPFVILGVASARLAVGFCLAFPISSLIASSGIGLRGEGDRALFEAGGYLLLEVLRRTGPSLLAVLWGLAPLMLLGLLLSVASHGALLIAINSSGKLRLRNWLGSVLDRLPALLVIAAGSLFAQLVLLTIVAMTTFALPEPMLNPQRHDVLVASLLLIGVGLAGAVGGFADVLKATLLRHQLGLREALNAASVCVARAPFRTCFGWLPFAALWLALAALVAHATAWLDVSRPEQWRLLAVFTLHQLVIVASVALRAMWLARALRLAATRAAAPPRRGPSGTTGRSVAPLGPTIHRPASPDA
jgi:hypothetical protein